MDFLNVQPVYMASSIKELGEQAKLPPFDQKIKVELYMRSAENILQQAQIYKLEGDLEQAYILLLKFAILVVEKIPKHKGYNECISPLKKQVRAKAAQAINEMEAIKSHLNKLYTDKQKKEEEEAAEAERQKQEQERQRVLQEQRIKEEEEFMRQKMASPIAPPPMAEVPLAPATMWMPEAAPPPYTPMDAFPGFPTPPESAPPMYSPPTQDFAPQEFVPQEFTGFPPPNSDMSATAPSLIDIPNDELTSQLPQKLDVGNLQKLSLEYQGPISEPIPENTPTTSDVAYPSPSPMGNIPNYKPSPKTTPSPPTPQHFIPPQMPPPGYMFPPQPMAMPPGFPVYGAPVPMGPPPGMVMPTYAPVKATAPVAPPKPADSPKTEPTPKKSKLRNMNMDGGMFQVFMDLAKPNTSKDIETCGILAGTLKNNAFQVTTLIIPKQTGTSDTCAMTHEDELFQYQQDNNLMTLGWIHTHPSHDCFLSSVDMHTHMSYQLMLDEAVAVVVAPKVTPNFGIFRLNEFGMVEIQSCEKRGFHPHQKGLYNTTEHVNVQFNGSGAYKVVDLRKK